MAAFQQVVAEDEVLRECAFQHLLEHAQVIDALAAERALVEDILIQLERSRSVHIQPAEAGHELRIAALVGDLHVDVDPRLHDAVAAVHALAVSAQPGLVQRVRHRPDELLRRVEHQLGVSVQRDDEAYERVTVRLRDGIGAVRVGTDAFRPLADGFRLEPAPLLLLRGLSEQQVVEVQYCATLALVPQPCLLALAPGAASVDEVEYRTTVFLVEFLDLGQAGLHHLVVPRRILLFVGGGVSHQRIVDIVERRRLAVGRRSIAAFRSPLPAFHYLPLATVDVAQVVHLQHTHQLLHLLLAFEDGGHDYHGGILVGHMAFFELQFEGASGMV